MQKIVPHLWFDNRAEEAMQLYTSIFGGSKITRLDRIPAGPAKGSVTGAFQLEGQDFMAIDAGPYFTFSPAVSFFVACDTREEVDRLWSALIDGGMALMPLDAYPFSARYGWLQDRYGVSWQLSLGNRSQEIIPFLMFVGDQHGKAEEAMNRYCGQFENSRVEDVQHYAAGESDPEGTVKHATFTLAGQSYMAIDSAFAHRFTFTGAISFFVNCRTQEEVDALWEGLSDGGEIQQCGWLKDRYGVYWQIVPTVLGELMRSGNAAKSKAVFDAMLRMKKLDIKQLEDAYAEA